MIKSAVILCGGYGKRLLPITKKIPKPMAMVNGRPFLYYLIKQCKLNGIKEIILLCGYKSEKIKKYFKNGNKFGLSIKYSFNPPDINTYKRLVDAKHLLKNDFLLLYSDNYSSLNLNDLYSVYKKLKSNSKKPTRLPLTVMSPCIKRMRNWPRQMLHPLAAYRSK